MPDRAEVVLFRSPYEVDQELADKCSKAVRKVLEEDGVMDDETNANCIHPFTHQNIMDAWNKMVSEYEQALNRSDYGTAKEVKNKMNALVSSLAAKAGE